MSTLLAGKFSSYQHNARELIQGGALTITQRETIQNDRALVAEQILSLVLDLNNPISCARDDAFLKGQLAVYNFILDRDEESQNLINSGVDKIS